MNVDIIVTTYKRTGLLLQALKSVADQSYQFWKCWIVEDGESKETYEAVRPFLKDGRFFYLPGRHAGFPAVPRNRGIKQGKAPYIALLDDDDIWLTRKLEHQMTFLKNNPACVLLGCNGYRWKGTGGFNKAPLYFKRNNLLGEISYSKFLNQNCLILSSVILRRDAVDKAGLFNEDPILPPGEDYELWLRVGALGEIWNLDKPLVVYRETPSFHYKKNLTRYENYRAAANIYMSALKGIEGIPSPLSYRENIHLAAGCMRERDFYLAGPSFLGRFRHEMQFKIRQILNI